MTFGQKLRHARREARMTQADVAKAIGVTATVVSRYEADIVTPPLNKYEALCAIFSIDPEIMFDNNQLRQSNQITMRAKTDRVTFLRKRIWALQSYLAWAGDRKPIASIYAIRNEIDQAMKEISSLLLTGAKMIPLSDPTLDEGLLDAFGELMDANMQVEAIHHAVIVHLKTIDGSLDDVIIEHCDDPRPGYFQIEGCAQNLTEWISKNRLQLAE